MGQEAHHIVEHMFPNVEVGRGRPPNLRRGEHPILKLKGAVASLWGRIGTYKSTSFQRLKLGGRSPNFRCGEHPILKLKGAAASLWGRVPSKPISLRTP